MRDSAREAIVLGARWGVIYAVFGALVGYAFFPDVVYGISVPTPSAKVILGVAIGIVGTAFSILTKYWTGTLS